jgi:hypothetical protein
MIQAGQRRGYEEALSALAEVVLEDSWVLTIDVWATGIAFGLEAAPTVNHRRAYTAPPPHKGPLQAQGPSPDQQQRPGHPRQVRRSTRLRRQRRTGLRPHRHLRSRRSPRHRMAPHRRLGRSHRQPARRLVHVRPLNDPRQIRALCRPGILGVGRFWSIARLVTWCWILPR